MKANAYCLWCDTPYVAARPPQVPSQGICWECVQREFPGLLTAFDLERLYGPEVAQLASEADETTDTGGLLGTAGF